MAQQFTMDLEKLLASLRAQAPGTQKVKAKTPKVKVKAPKAKAPRVEKVKRERNFAPLTPGTYRLVAEPTTSTQRWGVEGNGAARNYTVPGCKEVVVIVK